MNKFMKEQLLNCIWYAFLILLGAVTISAAFGISIRIFDWFVAPLGW